MKYLFRLLICLIIISFLAMFPTLFFSDLQHSNVGYKLLLAETGIITTSLGILGMGSIGNPFKQ